MTGITVKIMVEVLSILGIATKEIKQGRTKASRKDRYGRCAEEAGQTDRGGSSDGHCRSFKGHTYCRRESEGVDNRVVGVDERVAGVDDRVRAVDEKVAVVIDDGNKARVVIQQTANDVDQVKRTQLRQDLHRWLSPSDPSTNHNIACVPTTREQQSGSFKEAYSRAGSPPGSLLVASRKTGLLGRTIICSAIIQDLLSLRDTGMASIGYFYFDFRDKGKQTRANLLPSLVTQLSAVSQHVRTAISTGAGPGPLAGTRQPFPTKSSHMCHKSPGNRHPSRPRPLTSHRVSLHEQSGQKNDIVEYVTSVVHSDARMRRWREEDKKMVIDSLSERADGMFRWVFCQLEALRYCFPPSVRHMLEELPETLDETYERVLREIHKTKQGLAHRLLQCLTVAIRPLRVTELAEAASKLNTDWRWEDQQQAILSTCSSLIAVVDDDGSEVVQFAHFSVKEFLASSRLAVSSTDVSRFHIPLEPAHTIIAKACLGVLLRLDDRADGDTVETSFPLARYAAKHWADHAQFGNVSSYIREGMEDIFNPDKPFFSAWLHVYDIDVDLMNSPLYWFSLPSKVVAAPPLYYAALCGFHDLAEHLIVAALAKEHLDIAQLLYQRGADVDIVRSLLHHKADKNARSQDENGEIPLHIASRHGRANVVLLFLEHGVDVNVLDYHHSTPLHLASRSECLEVARLLIENGANLDAKDSFAGKECKELLLEHGATEGRVTGCQAIRLSYYEVVQVIPTRPGKHRFAKKSSIPTSDEGWGPGSLSEKKEIGPQFMRPTETTKLL
ncbi:hypothetical protein BC826DRAFT_1179252 [Russula brevipes]|nr:hypothetical protein BC826DRAFT_1179252 [Russula brevipes]